jgi:hypothetical protein
VPRCTLKRVDQAHSLHDSLFCNSANNMKMYKIFSALSYEIYCIVSTSKLLGFGRLVLCWLQMY